MLGALVRPQTTALVRVGRGVKSSILSIATTARAVSSAAAFIAANYTTYVALKLSRNQLLAEIIGTQPNSMLHQPPLIRATP